MTQSAGASLLRNKVSFNHKVASCAEHTLGAGLKSKLPRAASTSLSVSVVRRIGKKTHARREGDSDLDTLIFFERDS